MQVVVRASSPPLLIVEGCGHVVVFKSRILHFEGLRFLEPVRPVVVVWTAVGAAQASFVAGDNANLNALRNS